MARVEMNPALAAELARSPELAAWMKARVDAAAEAARELAPIGEDPDAHPGRFRDSIHGEVELAEGRVVGRVVSDDPAAAYIIFGTSDTPPHDTLMRGVEASRRA